MLSQKHVPHLHADTLSCWGLPTIFSISNSKLPVNPPSGTQLAVVEASTSHQRAWSFLFCLGGPCPCLRNGGAEVIPTHGSQGTSEGMACDGDAPYPWLRCKSLGLHISGSLNFNAVLQHCPIVTGAASAHCTCSDTLIGNTTTSGMETLPYKPALYDM